MNVVDSIQTVNLTRTTDGTIRIGNSRVALESIVHHFSLGATAEEIAQKFPSLKLAEVYGVIAYFLANREEVEDYIHKQDLEGDVSQSEIESRFRSEAVELQQRIVARNEIRTNALKR